jgi:hypothetical protein
MSTRPSFYAKNELLHLIRLRTRALCSRKRYAARVGCPGLNTLAGETGVMLKTHHVSARLR